MSLLRDLEDFVTAHRSHGQLFARDGDETSNGYRLSVGCPCGVIFERWVTPEDAAVDLALLAQ